MTGRLYKVNVMEGIYLLVSYLGPFVLWCTENAWIGGRSFCGLVNAVSYVLLGYTEVDFCSHKRLTASTSSRPICLLCEIWGSNSGIGEDYFFCGAAAQSGPWLLNSWCFYITHNDAPQSVGFLWTSDQLVAETSTWQHTTLRTEKHPCLWWNSNPRSQKASGSMDKFF